MAFDFPTAPAVDDPYTDPVSGAAYTYDGEKWVSAGSDGGGGTTPPAGGVPEAPIDTKQYGRQDAAWTEIAAAATGDFLPLTGGTMTGVMIINSQNALEFTAPSPGQTADPKTFRFKDAAGAEKFFLSYDGANSLFFGQTAVSDGTTAQGVMWFDRANIRVNFMTPPYVSGSPVVMKTEHDKAHNAALAKITALERRIAALEKRRV